jgi:hypothetical protein
MKLDEILELWGDDVSIDRSELGNAALALAKLHHKYYSILSHERLLMRKLESEMKELKLAKFEFFSDGPTQEQIDKGWKLPAKGRILRSDISNYVDADSDIIALTLKLAYQNEKLEVLTDIIKTVSNRGFHIKSAIDWERFKVGSM